MRDRSETRSAINDAGPESTDPPASPEPEEVRSRAADLAPEIRSRLLRLYDEGKRELPWRGETDPYRIWVSEVMLQQTRVETVLPYYKDWLDRFPTLEALAESEEEEVLRVWQGLGYYSRARNLQKGARMVRDRFNGEVPGDQQALLGIPGVGEYTAGAVASIAFGVPAPAVDGNARRVLSRVFDLPDPGKAQLTELAAALVDPARPGDFNQALMELGALVCTPRSPVCGECPVNGCCAAFANGTAEDRPAKTPRKPVPEVDVAVLVVVRAREGGLVQDGTGAASSGVGRAAAGYQGDGAGAGSQTLFFLRRRPSRGLLAGMWEFPGVEVEKAADVTQAAGRLATELGIGACGNVFELSAVHHVFSHLKARYWPVMVRVREPMQEAGQAPGRDQGPAYGPAGSDASAVRPEEAAGWFTPEEIAELPLPVAQGKIFREALEASVQESSSEDSRRAWPP